MSAETVSDQSLPPINPAELAPLDPAGQRAWALDIATAYADTNSCDVELLAAIAELRPSGSPEREALFEKVMAVSRKNMYRVWALRQLSLMDAPFAAAAWDEALASAGEWHMHAIGYAAEKPYALEVIIDGQTDPDRLKTVAALARAQHPPFNRILCAVAKQQATNGSDDAYQTRAELSRKGYHRDWDEASLALVELEMRDRHRVQNAYDHVFQLASHMQPWGCLKIYKHDQSQELETAIDEGLSAAWERYTPNQQLEIIDDLLLVGKTNLARELVFRQPPPVYILCTQRRDTIIRLAHYQARADLPGALATLDALEAEATEALNQRITTSMVLPLSTSDQFSEEGFVNRFAQSELKATINYAAMHRTALLVRHDPALALAEHARAAFLDDEPEPLAFKETARVVLAHALAEAGLTIQAATVAAAMSDNPLVLADKAKAFIYIARYTGANSERLIS